MNILLIGESSSRNLGDQAICVSLKRLFESRGHRVSAWDLSFYRYVDPVHGSMRSPNDVFVSNRSGPRPVVAIAKAAILRVVDLLPNSVQKRVVWLSKKRAALKRRLDWEREFRNFDLILFGGGALLIDNNWSFPLALLHYSRAARLAGKKYACVGCSTGEIYSSQGKRWLAEFLDHSNYIALRDAWSGKGLHLIGDYESEVFVDSALSIRDSFQFSRPERAGTLGLNLISLVRHPRLGMQAFAAYLEEIRRFIRALGGGEAGDWKRIVLFGTGEMRDFLAAADVAASFNGRSGTITVSVQPLPETLEELCETIAGFDLVISTRMHAGTIAKSYGRPLIAVGWDRKIRGFCEMVGTSDDYVDIEECRAEWLVERVSRIVANDFVQQDAVEECLSRLVELPRQVELLMDQMKETEDYGRETTRIY